MGVTANHKEKSLVGANPTHGSKFDNMWVLNSMAEYVTFNHATTDRNRQDPPNATRSQTVRRLSVKEFLAGSTPVV